MGRIFCEKTDMSKVVRQPTNTFSNFIYWISAIAILRRGWKDQSNRKRYNMISANPFYSIAFGGILLYIFFASTLFHSSLTKFSSTLDFSAVYSLTLFPFMYFTHRVWLLSIGLPSNARHAKSTFTVIIVFTTLYLLLTFFLPTEWRHPAVVGIILMMIVAAIIVERKDPGKTNHRYLAICVGSILIALMWYAFDQRKLMCNPDGYIQPHSLWHVFSGISAFYFYMYIRSEKNRI
ncbi:MAG: ceramidase domain-containing protein [Bacteroidetes bacterium]|nr:ceramidase domain-containing protein [Bacteroidota bacterium]